MKRQVLFDHIVSEMIDPLSNIPEFIVQMSNLIIA